SGALAAVARAKQGLEPRSVGLDEETFNLDFVTEERLACPTAMRFLTVRKLALRRSGQSFLFVGFGISQWYLRVLMKVLVRSLELHRTASSVLLAAGSSCSLSCFLRLKSWFASNACFIRELCRTGFQRTGGRSLICLKRAKSTTKQISWWILWG